MTLVLSLAQASQILHVSDRLVTSVAAGRPQSVHSPLENKTIIFLLRDAVGVLGYTGSAYVGHQNTDHWLAELLAGKPITNGWSVSFGKSKAERLNNVIWRMKNAVANLGVGRQLTVCMTGFHARRSYTFPFAIEFSGRTTRANDGAWMRPPRTRAQTTLFSAIGDPPPLAELMRTIREAADAAKESSKNPLQVGVVAAVRKRSQDSPFVGPHLMSVFIHHPSRRLIEWEFVPAQPHHAVLTTPTGGALFAAEFSPWLIAPGAIQAPSIGTGHGSMHVAGWEIRQVGQPRPLHTSTGSILYATSRQTRIPPPR